MYNYLIFFNSAFRWLIIWILFFTILICYNTYFKKYTFSKKKYLLRLIAITSIHIQFTLSLQIFNIQNPFINHFWSNFKDTLQNKDVIFFGFIHFILMFISVILITVDFVIKKISDKHIIKKNLWYLFRFPVIILVIPWSFSPFSNRPYFLNTYDV